MADRFAQIFGHLGADDDVAEFTWATAVAIAVNGERQNVSWPFFATVSHVQISDPLLADKLNSNVAILDPSRREGQRKQPINLRLREMAGGQVCADVVKLDHRLPALSLASFTFGLQGRCRALGEGPVGLHYPLDKPVPDYVIGTKADEVNALYFAEHIGNYN